MNDQQEKLIGGVPHVKAACAECGELIWVSKNSYIHSCSDCDSRHKSKREKAGRTDKAAGADIRYHGEFRPK